MCLHISTVSDVIDRLETKGYVVRKREARDRRVVTVYLTDEGRRITSKATEPTQGRLLDGLQKLSYQMEVEQIKVKFFSTKIRAKRL